MKNIRHYASATIGNLLRHYDQSIYGFLIPLLAPLFFPHEDPIYSLLAGYALLPLGLLAKPIGAYVFGRLGDRWGKKMSLSLTLLGIGCTTASIGFLPTFEEKGWIGPLLLGLARLLQNFFAAGETTGGALFLLEQTPEKKRGLMSSLFDATGIVGIFLAALAVTVISPTYWRWLFWIGGLSGAIGLILRSRGYKELPPPTSRSPWSSSDWTSMLSIALVSGFSYANYYLVFTFLNGFLPLVSHVTLKEALALNTLLLFIDLLLLPCFGWLSLHIKKEKLILAATFLGTCLACPLFLLLDGANAWIAGAVRIAFTIIGVCLAAPYHAWAMENTSERNRFTICAVGSALGGKLIGAPMPLIGLWLYHKTGWIGSPALPLIFSALLASGALLLLRRSPRLITDQKA